MIPSRIDGRYREFVLLIFYETLRPVFNAQTRTENCMSGGLNNSLGRLNNSSSGNRLDALGANALV